MFAHPLDGESDESMLGKLEGLCSGPDLESHIIHLIQMGDQRRDSSIDEGSSPFELKKEMLKEAEVKKANEEKVKE